MYMNMRSLTDVITFVFRALFHARFKFSSLDIDTRYQKLATYHVETRNLTNSKLVARKFEIQIL